MITPLSRSERPDQAAITYPPPICTQADESSAQTYSSSRSVSESKTTKGSFNVGFKATLPGGVDVGSSYEVLSLPIKGRS